MRRILCFNFLFCLFFLFGCSAVTSAESHYEIKTEYGSYECDFRKGQKLSCVKIEKEIENGSLQSTSPYGE